MTDSNVILCQSCGAANPVEAPNCGACGAPMAAALKRRETAAAKEAVLAQLPAEAAARIRELEAKLEATPDSVALCVQLSNLYKDYGRKDYAVEYLSRAAEQDPTNRFLQQKVRLLIDGGRADRSPPPQHAQAEREVKKYVRWIGVAAGAVVALLLGGLAWRLLFPNVFCLVRPGTDRDAVAARFSPDGQKIAYLDTPRLTFFQAFDDMRGGGGETWIVAEPQHGKPVRLAKVGQGRRTGWQFAWRPGADQLTYVGSGEKKFDGPYIFSIAAQGGEAKALAEGEDFAWSRDGRYLAFVRYDWRDHDQRGLFLLEPATGAERRISSLDCQHPSWSPRTNEVAFQAIDREKMWGDIRDRFLNGDEGDSKKTWRDYVGDIYRYDVANDLTTPVTRNGRYRSPTYLPSGAKIAALTYASDESYVNNLVTMNLDGTDVKTLLSPNDKYEWFGEFSFSPDGKSVAFEGFFENTNAPPPPASLRATGLFNNVKRYASDVFLVGVDGGNPVRVQLRRHKFKSGPVFSPDGKYLTFEALFLDNHHEIWAMRR